MLVRARRRRLRRLLRLRVHEQLSLLQGAEHLELLVLLGGLELELAGGHVAALPLQLRRLMGCLLLLLLGLHDECKVWFELATRLQCQTLNGLTQILFSTQSSRCHKVAETSKCRRNQSVFGVHDPRTSCIADWRCVEWSLHSTGFKWIETITRS